ncbi:Chimeric ERCC6-PGBD3 protein Chimeric CSB-PGBD3 protein [Channa argus]|uniref:Chimeric ERCC6-PGBD3 protein Chimeric CSB-PGBD3 protein n=1 Tax=Channa argus TaxID=215402 RepID=A0A6G1Q5F8_CHAAH|nr:Chimeric ERCC6-PGBD3 protein Chimeric CSB-PGBD3 protein [Channa argus]
MRVVVMRTPFHSPVSTNPVGVKNFVSVTADGIVLDFDLYQNRDALLEQVEEAEGLGLGSLVKARLCQTLRPGTKVYCDRFFTSIQGAEQMMKKELYMTGTMGGVDLADRMINYYRMSTRTKKWTMRMLMHFTDLALANSWLLYCKDLSICGTPKNSIVQFLEFLMEVARTLLAQHHSQEDDADLSELSEEEEKFKTSEKPSSGGSAPCLSPQKSKWTSPRDDQPEVRSTLQSTRLQWEKPNALCDLQGVLVLTS